MDYQNKSQDERLKDVETALKHKLDQSLFQWIAGIIVAGVITSTGWAFASIQSIKSEINNQNSRVIEQLAVLKTDVSWIRGAIVGGEKDPKETK